MAKSGWSLLLVGADPVSRVRQIRLSGMILSLLIAITAAGSVGFVRLAIFGMKYGAARLGVYQELQENSGLLAKVRFLRKFMQQESDKIEAMISFEDQQRLKYGMNRISNDVRRAGVGGRPSAEERLISSMMDPVVMQAEAVRESLGVLVRQAVLQDSTFSRTAEHVKRMYEQWSSRPAIWPVRGRITSGYGYRYHPFAGYNLFHEGIDIANQAWTPIFATADGIVKTVGMRDYFGRMVVINHHGTGYETAYAHLQQTAVPEGQVVRRGELVGYMGNTGRSTGPHLHYEVREAGRPVNPMGFVLPPDRVVD